MLYWFVLVEILRESLVNRKILILSAALLAIKGYQLISKLAWECTQTLDKLALRNTLMLSWVWDTRGLRAIRMPTLAGEGALSPFYGPKPAYGISKTGANDAVESWAREEYLKKWHALRERMFAKCIVD